MNFIKDQRKYQKIAELAKSGDQKAKDFLGGFMDMSDEEANAYLASIAIEPEVPTPDNVNTPNEDEDWKKNVENLIKDENEAIDGYDKAIKFLANSHFCDDVIKQGYIQKLEHIKNEEIEHINELKEIL